MHGISNMRAVSGKAARFIGLSSRARGLGFSPAIMT